MLFASTPVRLAGEIKSHARVEVILKDVYRMNDRIYVRYAIQNQGQSIYRPGTPDVFSLRSPRSPSSLYALTKCQLVGDALRIKSDGQASAQSRKRTGSRESQFRRAECMGLGRVRTADWAEKPLLF